MTAQRQHYLGPHDMGQACSVCGVTCPVVTVQRKRWDNQYHDERVPMWALMFLPDQKPRPICAECSKSYDQTCMMLEGKATLWLWPQERVLKNALGSLSIPVYRFKRGDRATFGRVNTGGRFDVWIIGPEENVWHGTGNIVTWGRAFEENEHCVEVARTQKRYRGAVPARAQRSTQGSAGSEGAAHR